MRYDLKFVFVLNVSLFGDHNVIRCYISPLNEENRK